MESVEKGIEILSLNDSSPTQEESLAKIELEFQTYRIEPDSMKQEFSLPTPESLEKFIEPNKNLIKYDISKYKSLIKETENGHILDLSSISGISDNASILKKILFYLGGLTGGNDIYQYYPDDTNIPEHTDIEETNNYGQYLLNNREIFTFKFQIQNSNELFSCLNLVGIDISDEKNIYRTSFKDYLLSTEENKILVLLTPSNNFWIKSERSVINDVNYDQKLNNYSKIFLNHPFITKFLEKVANHKRCFFGLLSSMTMKNLKPAKEAIFIAHKTLKEDKYLLFDQKCHDNIHEGQRGVKPEFYRSMEKIIKELKVMGQKKKKDDENSNSSDWKEALSSIKEERIIILESEESKISDSTRNNSIEVNVFSEQYLDYSKQKKEIVDLEGDKIIDYIVNLLNNCDTDVREYISKNPIKVGEKYVIK